MSIWTNAATPEALVTIGANAERDYVSRPRVTLLGTTVTGMVVARLHFPDGAGRIVSCNEWGGQWRDHYGGDNAHNLTDDEAITLVNDEFAVEVNA